MTSGSIRGFAIVEHTADLGLRAWGPAEKDVFEQAAVGMFSLICDPYTVDPALHVDLEVEAPMHDLLLVEWLNELLYLSESLGMVFAAFTVETVGESRLLGAAVGERIDEFRHDVRAGVKAATYHRLSVEERDGAWEATVFLDV